MELILMKIICLNTKYGEYVNIYYIRSRITPRIIIKINEKHVTILPKLSAM